MTGSATEKDKVLCYEESDYKNYMLIDPESGDYPENPSDAITWFNPAFNEWLT